MASSSPKETETRFYTFGSEAEPFLLQSGESLGPVTVAYETYGKLNKAKDNAILLFHALSGSQHAAGYTPEVEGLGERWTEECRTGWWSDFIGPGKALNTDAFFVICANYLGGCYGSTGPSSLKPASGKPYGSSFPRITIADIVDSQIRLLDHLGIRQLHAVTGASLGGMMSASLATRYPDRVRIVIPIASCFEPSVLQRIHNFEQICAIVNDPHFNGGDYYDGLSPNGGLALARMVAHKTYRSLGNIEFQSRQDIRQPDSDLGGYHLQHAVESYLHYQGSKFVERFDANTYLRIIEAWQRFDLTAEGGETFIKDLLARCADQHFLIFSIDSDVSFYSEEQATQARLLRKAGVRKVHHITVNSDKGHDAFLLEPDLFTPHLVYTLENRW